MEWLLSLTKQLQSCAALADTTVVLADDQQEQVQLWCCCLERMGRV